MKELFLRSNRRTHWRRCHSLNLRRMISLLLIYQEEGIRIWRRTSDGVSTKHHLIPSLLNYPHMKNRITELFASKKKHILNVYFTAGFPKLNDTVAIAKALEESGA